MAAAQNPARTRFHTGDDKPREVAVINKRDLADLDAMNLWQQGDLLLIALGSFFDPKGSHAGLAIIDVRNPTRPETLSTWKSKERLRGSAMVIADRQSEHANLGA